MDDKASVKTGSWKIWKKRRYVVAVLVFFGFFNVYALRSNMSIAIVKMTEAKNVTLPNGTIVVEREFDWDTKLQGYILSSFFYGYITTQLAGGIISARIGGKLVFGTGIAVTAVLTIITPWMVEINVYFLLATRIIEGIFEGVTYPSIYAVWNKWAPPLERSRLATIGFSGSYIGTVVSMPLSSYLAETLGWPSIFYVFGSIALVWFLLWIVIVAESPEKDSRISEEELTYIVQSMDPNSSDDISENKIPIRSILCSLPFWAIVSSNVCELWGFYTLLTQLPKFMKNALDFDLKKAGFLSALPYLAMAFMVQFAGQIADWLISRKILTTTQVRKIFNFVGFAAQVVFMLAAAFWMSPYGTTFCLVAAVGIGAFAFAGFSVNHLDIAPQYASMLMGMTNTFGTLPGIISPILTGYLVTDETNADQWKVIFYISAGIYLFGALFYAAFGSGEIQQWAKNNATESSVKKQQKKRVEETQMQ